MVVTVSESNPPRTTVWPSHTLTAETTWRTAEAGQDGGNQNQAARKCARGLQRRVSHLIGVVVAHELGQRRDHGQVDGEAIRQHARNYVQRRPQFHLLGHRIQKRRLHLINCRSRYQATWYCCPEPS